MFIKGVAVLYLSTYFKIHTFSLRVFFFFFYLNILQCLLPKVGVHMMERLAGLCNLPLLIRSEISGVRPSKKMLGMVVEMLAFRPNDECYLKVLITFSLKSLLDSLFCCL